MITLYFLKDLLLTTTCQPEFSEHGHQFGNFGIVFGRNSISFLVKKHSLIVICVTFVATAYLKLYLSAFFW